MVAAVFSSVTANGVASEPAASVSRVAKLSNSAYTTTSASAAATRSDGLGS